MEEEESDLPGGTRGYACTAIPLRHEDFLDPGARAEPGCPPAALVCRIDGMFDILPPYSVLPPLSSFRPRGRIPPLPSPIALAGEHPVALAGESPWQDAEYP
ncbi:unnamed protein product [Prorocentrum cordatum]|uniref:Uncharacterized protein n=1 Tax=Prorocentrum cordatum TaxID=2364126 RepID=A0ABN9XMB3_9DINO|nr:unnamed protein product [Polarella glacialis]